MSYIVSVIWEVDFMKDLGAVLLDGVHFYHMGRKLPGLLTEGTKHSDKSIVHSQIYTDHSSLLFYIMVKAEFCFTFLIMTNTASILHFSSKYQ